MLCITSPWASSVSTTRPDVGVAAVLARLKVSVIKHPSDNTLVLRIRGNSPSVTNVKGGVCIKFGFKFFTYDQRKVQLLLYGVLNIKHGDLWGEKQETKL
jgi:hypothetical protein